MLYTKPLTKMEVILLCTMSIQAAEGTIYKLSSYVHVSLLFAIKLGTCRISINLCIVSLWDPWKAIISFYESTNKDTWAKQKNKLSYN